MRLASALCFCMLAAMTSACSDRSSGLRYDGGNRRTENDSDTAARKAGRAAYNASKEAGKIAAEAGREIKKEAQQAHEGWKDAKRESRERKP